MKIANDNSNSELPNLEHCKTNRLSRSRSGSPANFDIKPFEKEKSPFLQVKQLLKPVKKAAVSTEPEWKKVGKQLKPRIAPLALQPSSKVKNQVEKNVPLNSPMVLNKHDKHREILDSEIQLFIYIIYIMCLLQIFCEAYFVCGRYLLAARGKRALVQEQKCARSSTCKM